MSVVTLTAEQRAMLGALAESPHRLSGLALKRAAVCQIGLALWAIADLEGDDLIAAEMEHGSRTGFYEITDAGLAALLGDAP